MSQDVKTTFVKETIFPIQFVLHPGLDQQWRGLVRSKMKIIEKAKYIKSGDTVLDRGTRFIIKEVRVSAVDGGVVFIDMEGAGHGVYHPDEYLGVGEVLARKYAATYGGQIAEEIFQLDNMASQMIH